MPVNTCGCHCCNCLDGIHCKVDDGKLYKCDIVFASTAEPLWLRIVARLQRCSDDQFRRLLNRLTR